MNNVPLTQAHLLRLVATRLLVAIPVMMAVLFLPAGTFDYWEAWVYLAILLIPMVFVLAYLLKNDPALLERRMRMREKEAAQKRIIKISYFYFLFVFVLPGLDKRAGWSDVPAGVVVAADLIVLLSYSLVVLVFRENSYASRIIEVAPEQKVIRSGPYALVRHPMYLGVLTLYIFSPLALGSYWAMIPAILFVPIIVARIRNEESVLVRDLPGYQDYMGQTRFRLVPGIW